MVVKITRSVFGFMESWLMLNSFVVEEKNIREFSTLRLDDEGFYNIQSDEFEKYVACDHWNYQQVESYLKSLFAISNDNFSIFEALISGAKEERMSLAAETIEHCMSKNINLAKIDDIFVCIVCLRDSCEFVLISQFLDYLVRNFADIGLDPKEKIAEAISFCDERKDVGELLKKMI